MVTLDYEIGQKVKMVGAPDIEAIVTAFTIRQGSFVSYELTWIHEGEVKTGWVTNVSIETERKGKIGFVKQADGAKPGDSRTK
jgi:hypothetical protein